MKRLISWVRFFAVIGIMGLFVASLAGWGLGAVVVVQTVISMITTHGQDTLALVHLIEVLDIFLVAAALFIFGVSLYELFVGELNLPSWLVVKDFEELKSKVIGVVVLVMAITFLEHLVAWTDASATLLFGIAIAVVSLVLVLLYRTSGNGH